jgi:nucleotide-binding universal stress UspA family protein
MDDSSRNDRTGERAAADPIVVGFDGSVGSESALRWAAQEALYRGAPLRVVHAWEAPPQLVAGAGWVPPDGARLEELAQAARGRLDTALAALANELRGLDVEPRAEHGPASAVLLDASTDAALLVVGTRGHGGFTGLLLGSVGQQVAQHAPCPVAVIPPVR